MCALICSRSQLLATEPVLTLTSCPNSQPRYATSAACARQLIKAPPGLSPPGLKLLDSIREQHPLRRRSRLHLQEQSSSGRTEADSSDAETSSNCSTTDTMPQDGQTSTCMRSKLVGECSRVVAVRNPKCVLQLDIALPEPAPFGHQNGRR